MRLISLNIWGGREFNPLTEYVTSKAPETDIFCFQEVFHTQTDKKVMKDKYRVNIYSELSEMLTNHKGHFVPIQDDFSFDDSVDFPFAFGIAMFLNKNIAVKEVANIPIFGYYNSKKSKTQSMPKSLQYATIQDNNLDYVIAHFHGLYTNGDKKDTSERLTQSQIIKQTLDREKGKKILCGDFNLLPHTKSLKLLEYNNINLIKENNIATTRSPLYNKPDKFADYTIVSTDVNVHTFSVDDVKVSDHLPMIIEFS